MMLRLPDRIEAQRRGEIDQAQFAAIGLAVGDLSTEVLKDRRVADMHGFRLLR
jgi:hypothetical protein